MSTTTTLPLTAGTWQVDTAHSSIEFVVRHLGLTKVRGRFNQFDTTLEVGTDLTQSTLSASVDLSSVDTANADRDAHLKSTDFFDVDRHPTMTFAADRIAASTGGDTDRHDGRYYLVDGHLTLNGITRPVRLDVEFAGSEVYPMDQKTHAGFSATTTISRSDYGVEFDVPVGVDRVAIGDKVKVELEIQLVQP